MPVIRELRDPRVVLFSAYVKSNHPCSSSACSESQEPHHHPRAPRFKSCPTFANLKSMPHAKIIPYHRISKSDLCSKVILSRPCQDTLALCPEPRVPHEGRVHSISSHALCVLCRAERRAPSQLRSCSLTYDTELDKRYKEISDKT